MAFGETKVYFDGSHYIAIPHTTRPSKKRYKPPEETVEVKDDKDNVKTKETDSEDNEMDSTLSDLESVPFEVELEEIEVDEDIFPESEPPPIVISPRRATRKDLFEEAYKENIDLPRKKRKQAIYKAMRQYFNTDNDCETFVQLNMERKARNLMCRRIRMTRKANLADFNYFCTFTYDSKLHDEDTFKKKLKTAFRHFCNRKGWRYMGVWERSPEKKRLHFHGLFHIPEGTMPEMCIERNDYSFSTHKRQTINQNTYFLKRFGRNDFEPICDQSRMNDATAYLMKYMEKSGEKVVYSKGLPQFFITDIMDDDIICKIGMEEQKLLLYDDFSCWDEGVYIGQVSNAVISQLRKAN
jgi:hypothetical protein